jgi:hypothetical protein
MKELNMNEIPKWDVALEAVAKDTYEKQGRPMNLADFKQLCKEYEVRFDDMMHSLCQLVANEMWSQQGFDETGNSVSEDLLAELFVFNRLDEKIAEKYAVVWQPRAEAYKET